MKLDRLPGVAFESGTNIDQRLDRRRVDVGYAAKVENEGAQNWAWVLLETAANSLADLGVEVAFGL